MGTLTVAQAQSYAQSAGFTGNALNIIVAIAQAESSLNTNAKGTNTDGSIDRGILQINNKWHAEVSDACAYDPACAFQQGYRISNKGTNFSPWSTYTSGAYKKYLSGGSNSNSVQSGDGNNFPPGQCTWWADERYHQLTGHYVPWNHTGQANAYQWLSQANAYGWNTASTPPKGIPSIICLQGNAGQGVLSSLGHVAIVEKVNSDGSVVTSNMNFNVGPLFSTNINTLGYPVHQITFKQGNGVSFIWAGTSGATTTSNGGGGAGGASSTTYTPLLEQVHETLVNVPGFYGIALALDEAEQFPGWVNLVDSSNSWDIVGYIRSTGATITDNFVPFMIRSTLFTFGMLIMILLVLKVVLEVGDQALPIIKAAM